MAEVKFEPNRCEYKIARGSTLDELEKVVNDIIARSWDADGSMGNWGVHGDIGQDGNGFYQAMIRCPLQQVAFKKKDGKKKKK